MTNPMNILKSMIECTCDRSTVACIHDDIYSDLRSVLIDYPETPAPNYLETDLPIAMILYSVVEQLHENPYRRHDLSMLALDQSLCPVHMIDYAICFDDDNPDCAQIREYFPSHDT